MAYHPLGSGSFSCHKKKSKEETWEILSALDELGHMQEFLGCIMQAKHHPCENIIQYRRHVELGGWPQLSDGNILTDLLFIKYESLA